jgi:hypothetical protein
VDITTLQPRRWVGALVVTAAAAVALGSAGTAGAQVQPLPAAGWHGRPIQHPEKAVSSPVRTDRAGGPASVREVQRMLLRIGYAPGPVDGIYGVRTRSSVQWFQIKHGMRPTGVVDPATLRALRSRGGSQASEPAPPRRHVAPVAPADIEKPAPAAAHVAQPRDDGVGIALVAVLVVLGTAALVLLTLFVRRMRGTAAPRPAAAPHAVGYAGGRDNDELESNAAAIQHACDERGWALTCLVRDGAPARKRRALTFALDQAAREPASRLVVGRLEHLGKSLREVAALLTWCARHHVALIALDVGLDTGTAEGRLAARRMVAEAASHAQRRRSQTRARSPAAPSG